MLIRTAPAKLHIGMGLSCGAEGFSKRIQGNYGLIGVNFAPRDLLLLITEPPEAAEPQAGMTVLVDQSGRQDVWNVAMDVVNNVVNRILLDGSAHFSYQDQVYITTVLNRLGVTDTERFMTQVRQLRAESESTARLLALYRTELARLQERQKPELPPFRLPVPLGKGGGPAPDVELALTILRRLGAVRNFQQLHSLRRSWSSPVNCFQSSELRLSEQLRFGNSVALEETKRQVFQNARLSLAHHLNRYELEAVETEGGAAVLSQAAAAGLAATVDNVLVQVLNRPGLRQNQWLRVESALWQSGENSLARFTLYHGATPPAAFAALSWAEENVWNRYVGELREYQALRQYLYPQAAELPHPFQEAEGTSVAFLPPQEEAAGNGPLPDGKGALPAVAEEARRSAFKETKVLETARGRLEGAAEAEGRRLPPERRTGQGPVIRHIGRRTETDHLRESVLKADRLQMNRRYLERILRERKLWPPTPSVRERTFRLEREALRQEGCRTKAAGAAGEECAYPVPAQEQGIWAPPSLGRRAALPAPQPLVLTAWEAEEQAPELLVEAIRQIDQHNRTILRSIPAAVRERGPAPLPAPDLRRTLKESIRVLSEPAALLRETVEERQAAEPAAQLALAHREEVLLRQLPAGERRIYEAVLAYEKDPEGARGLLRPGSLGEFYRALRLAERPAAELTHPAAPETETMERLTERTGTVLERVLQIPARQERRNGTYAPPPAVKIIHKAAPEEATEEERRERRHTQATVQVDSRREEARRHEERQVDVTRRERTLVSETTEDITALVNRALAGQVKSISDQVYRQMERRLQMERSRRGRM